MSLAVPSSYSEYLFDTVTRTHTPQMLCNGGIMTTRVISSSAGTNYVKCLRGEDIFFLMEAVYSRASMTDFQYQSSLGVGMDDEIKASRPQGVRDTIWAVRTKWQESQLSVAVHDFGTTEPSPASVESWLFSNVAGIGNGLQYVSFSPGGRLYADDIYTLFQAVRKMNYSVDATDEVVVSRDTSHTVRYRILSGGTWSEEDEPFNTLWSSVCAEGFVSGTTLNSATYAQSTPESINVELTVAQDDNWVLVADYLPLALVKVENSWAWENTTTSESDRDTETHWVLVPLTDTYVSVQGGGAQIQGVRAADDVIGDAFTAAGLEREANDISMTSPTRTGIWAYRKDAWADIAAIFKLVHFKYCVP